MTDFVCWRCIKREVETPGDECDACFQSEDRAQRKRANGERETGTHERTHEKYRANLTDADIDAESFRRWSELR